MLLHVFVFGTLKEGFPNFGANKGIRIPGKFVTAQRLPLYLVGERHSPWLVNAPGEGHQVAGQVYQVDLPALEQMDVLERVNEPDGYKRLSIEVVAQGASSSCESMHVFAYLKQPEQFNLSSARLGPLDEYTLEHAALYRGRALTPPTQPTLPIQRKNSKRQSNEAAASRRKGIVAMRRAHT
jgi:gamma-glutamylaminecyclotransferase